ncbi:MAG: ABC transporter substrate-binding protein [Pigmentiphaga sp.]|uniref:heme/hemin ABC transporter substrate-binding protein n=1 Tax=Pigmentiphaga sp. TaxID=1977564 RepID=UPI0029A9CC37|nr:ABC transporter substrate-binding protein [Pigmentiphaga sp.]MDX3905024.1 ABC transporter substrate-binding protein [Pigmentiphaga sp.]
MSSSNAPGEAAPVLARRRALLGGLPACLLLAAAGPAAHAATHMPRVVSVGGGVTEIVYALGAASQLVGVDTSSLYPAQALALPKVGYQRTLAAEGVIALAPQVVLAGREAGPPAVLRQLEAAGIKVVRVDGAYTFEGVAERIATAAAALGREDGGRALISSLSARWAALRQRMDEQPLRGAQGGPLRVACLMRHGSTSLIAGRDTGADAMLGLVGAVNVFGESFAQYRPLSAEALVHAAPDAVIGTVDGAPDASARAALLATPGLALTPAGRHARAIPFDIVLLLGFGPRLPQAAEALYEALRV